MAEDRARFDLRYVSLEDVQVRPADRRGVDADDCVRRIEEHRIRDGLPGPLTWAVIHESVHSASFCHLMFARCRLRRIGVGTERLHVVSADSDECRDRQRDPLRELHEPRRIRPLVVVPGDHFCLCSAGDRRQLGIDDRGIRRLDHVAGDERLEAELQDPLELGPSRPDQRTRRSRRERSSPSRARPSGRSTSL